MKKGYLIVLVTLTLLSLAFNGVVILGLLRARQIALATVTGARATVIGVSDDTLSYTLEVKQEIPIVTSIPFDEDVIVPIRTTIPVSTTIVVPVNLGISTYDLEIPIRTTIPVDLEVPSGEGGTVSVRTTIPINTTTVVPVDLGITTNDLEVPIRTTIPVDLEVVVPISKTVHVATTVALDVDVPIEISIADTPLVGYLEELDAVLARIETGLGWPFGGKD